MTQSAISSWRQIRAMTRASLKSRYRNSAAGWIWVMLNPIFIFSAQAFVFSQILKLNVENYHLFLLTGLLPWIFLSNCISMCTTNIVHHGRLLKSFPIHPISTLASIVLDNLINFCAAFLFILIPVLLFSKDYDASQFLLLPLPMLSLLAAALGLSLLLATLQVFLSDTKFIMDFVMSISFYLTPIMYPASFVDESHRWIIHWNPFAILISPFQKLGQVGAIFDFWPSLIQSFTLSAVILGISILFWRKNSQMVYLKI